ncbi:MAG: hypothetical protein GQ574_29310 [Crocinitomix sp.]|nr:hypothetical protein [Crocinitomix sp.]
MLIRKVLIILFISCSFIWSCTDKPQIPESVKPESFPVVINSVDCCEDPIEKEYLSYSRYTLLYIGSPSDSINVNWRLSGEFGGPPPTEIDPIDPIDPEFKRKGRPLSKYSAYDLLRDGYYENIIPAGMLDLKIRIDTSQLINYMFGQYPVFITNNSLDTAIIASRNEIPAIMEAIDESGKWRAIEEPLIGCGTGVTHIILPPNEMVLSGAPIFKGEFKTAFRIRIGDNVSNIFFGSINPNQFESAYDKHGNYK